MCSRSAMPCKPRTKRGETHDRYSTVALATTYHTPQTETLKEIQIMEYVIWGIPPGQADETILLAEPNGTPITSIEAARQYLKQLEAKHGCSKCRIQTLDGTLPNFAAAIR